MSYEELVAALIRCNHRECSIPPLPPPGTDLWWLTDVTDHDGNQRNDPKRRAWVGHLVMFIVIKCGYEMMFEFIQSNDGYLMEGFVRTTLIVGLYRDDESIAAKTRNGSIYHFKRERNFPMSFEAIQGQA